MRAHSLAIVVPPDASVFEMACALAFLVEPPIDHGGDWYAISLLGKPGAAGAGFSTSPLEPGKQFQTLVVLPTRTDVVDPDVVDYLRQADLRATRTVSICTGALMLAEAGLLRRRRATTHWRYGEKLRQADPTIRLVPDVLYVEDGDVLTSAGAAAGIDLILHLVRTDFGIDAATKLAQSMVVAPHREGGHPQFVDDPISPSGNSRINGVIADMKARPDIHYSIEDLASRSAMSKRSFQRHFSELTGVSPREWLIRRRIDRAISLLREGRCSLDNVASQAGFGGADQMRHHFRRRLGQPPSRYIKNG